MNQLHLSNKRTIIKDTFKFQGRISVNKYLKGKEDVEKVFLTQINTDLFSFAYGTSLNMDHEYAVYEGTNHVLLCHLAANIKEKATSSLVTLDESTGAFAETYPTEVSING